MAIEFYEYPFSPYCRSVKLIASIIKVPLESKIVNLVEQEQLKPEYVKINHFHQVPTINDNGFYLAESRAIASYLIDKYSPNHQLYPVDMYKRAAINQMLHFDSGSLAPAVAGLIRPIVFDNTLPTLDAFEKARELLKTLDSILKSKKYVAGNEMSIADITIRATLSMNEVINSLDISQLKNLTAWAKKIRDETSPAYKEINDMAMEKFREYMLFKLSLISTVS